MPKERLSSAATVASSGVALTGKSSLGHCSSKSPSPKGSERLPLAARGATVYDSIPSDKKQGEEDKSAIEANLRSLAFALVRIYLEERGAPVSGDANV